MSKGIIDYTYHPNMKVATWGVEIEFEARNLTPEQAELARKIINEKSDNEIYGIHKITDILIRLLQAGFRGNIVHSPQLDSPLLIVLNSKIDKEK